MTKYHLQLNLMIAVLIFAGCVLTNDDLFAQRRIARVSGAEVDVPFGVLTKEEIAKLESIQPDSSLSTKTISLAPDGDHEAYVLNIVIDFKEAGQDVTSDVFGNQIGTLDLSEFGFSADQFEMVKDAILNEVVDDYFDELAGTVANQNEMELQVNFMAGDIGTAPPGVFEYYFVQVGSGISGPHVNFTLGVAGLSLARNSVGEGPNFGIENGDVIGSIFSDNIQNLGNLSPSNALSSGNLTFTTNALAGTISHEVGHTLSLSHANFSQSTQPTAGSPPIMGTGAIDLPNQARLADREFSLVGFNAENGNSQIFHIQQLADAIGLEFFFAGPLGNNKLTVNLGNSKGGLPELKFNDNSTLEILVADKPPSKAPPIEFEVAATTPDLNPATLTLRVEARSSSRNVTQRIEIFNIATGSFDSVDEREITMGMSFSFDLELTENIADYIDPASCQIRCRASYFATGPVLLYPWKIEVDLLNFRINL